MRIKRVPGCCLTFWLFSAGVIAADGGYAVQEYPTRVLWGDTHLHTTNSLDARTMGVQLDPEGAYRFARGETVTTSLGHRARLARPLDFLVVADHSDAMGVVDQLLSGNPRLLKNKELRQMRDKFLSGGDSRAEAL